MAPETIGPYRLLEPIREGGASSVYRAVPTGTPGEARAVALKVFSPHLLENPAVLARLRRDALATVPLSHPNILQVLAIGQDGDRVYLATELFAGSSLETFLEQRQLTLPEAIAVMKRICRGLAYAHQRGFVHGHLTPRHVLVSADLAQVKLADFGPSEAETVAGLDTTMLTGAIDLRALQYLAPEQAALKAASPATAQPPAAGLAGSGGGPPADPRVDLYAAGVLCHELLSGRRPGGKFALPSHLNPAVPSAADVLVLKCLARDPAQRYGTAGELLAALEKLEEALKVRLLSHLRGLSRGLGGRRRALLAGALVALLAVLVLIGYLLLGR
jgi:serine/threonine protein kinase